MEKDKLENILQDLYSWNPKLRAKEAELIKLIEVMAEARPDTQFDENFAASLKKDLLSHRILLDDDEGLEENNFVFNFNHMSKKIYVGLGAIAVCGLAVVAILVSRIQDAPMISYIEPDQLAVKDNLAPLVQTRPGAFGSLASLSVGTVNNSGAEIMAGSATAGNDIAVTSVEGKMSPDASVQSMAAAPVLGLGGFGGDMGRMILPMRTYEYTYTGEPIELAVSSDKVYRRLKGDGALGGNFDSLVNGKMFGPLDLKSFSGLQTSYITLNENKRFGYSINIDLKEENIYIGQNWQQWQSERDQCGDNSACWESYRIKIENVPGDETLISKANQFLSEQKISLTHYGEPQIDNVWRLNYETASDKANYYIPEEISVIYPLVVDDQKVYDQSGNLDGLRVNVNLLHDRVSGVSNLTPYRYEVSEYALETDSEKVLNWALKGANNYGIYYSEGAEQISLELGTPTRSLIRYWRYNNGLNDELLIPALIFPINNRPSDYYGSRYVVVPLVQEMLDEAIKNYGGGYGGDIMPVMPMVR